jgi:ABC-2 type transport system permease protein
MRLFFELARRGYRRYAAYPAATFGGLFTNTVFGFMRAYVLLAIFRETAEVNGYDAQDTVTYAWMTQGLIATIYIWGWFELGLRIRTGDIATDLSRPVDLQFAAFASDMGRALYHAIFRGIPPILVGALVFELTAPSDPLMWLAFAASTTLAVAVSFSFRFLYNLPAFWLLDYRGVAVLAMIAANLFSGFIIPVRFFPDWLAAIANATPFPSMVQTPVDMFVGETHGLEIVSALLVQTMWLVVLLALGRWVLAAGTRRLVVQGG